MSAETPTVESLLARASALDAREAALDAREATLKEREAAFPTSAAEETASVVVDEPTTEKESAPVESAEETAPVVDEPTTEKESAPVESAEEVKEAPVPEINEPALKPEIKEEEPAPAAIETVAEPEVEEGKPAPATSETPAEPEASGEVTEDTPAEVTKSATADEPTLLNEEPVIVEAPVQSSITEDSGAAEEPIVAPHDAPVADLKPEIAAPSSEAVDETAPIVDTPKEEPEKESTEAETASVPTVEDVPPTTTEDTINPPEELKEEKEPEVAPVESGTVRFADEPASESPLVADGAKSQAVPEPITV